MHIVRQFSGHCLAFATHVVLIAYAHAQLTDLPSHHGSSRNDARTATLIFPADLPQVDHDAIPRSDAVSPLPTSPSAEAAVSQPMRSAIHDGGIVTDQAINPLPSGDQIKGQAGPFVPDSVFSQLNEDQVGIPVSLDGLFMMTAQHSARVQSVKLTSAIAATQINQAQGAFDPQFFSEGRFDSTSDPVENILVTGGAPRLEDDIASWRGGLRGTTRRGESYELSQRLGHKNSNSDFFLPNDQGSSRLAASVTKPLMRDRKIDRSRTLVLTATFDSEAAKARFSSTLQQQFVEVSDRYWRLYQERCFFLLRQRHLQRIAEIAKRLELRESLDSNRSQILRARAEVQNRRTDLIGSSNSVERSQLQLESLVNSPEWETRHPKELIPIQPADLFEDAFDAETEIATAIRNRPEIKELKHRVESMRVNLRLAENQLAPRLDLVLEGYLAGLQGSSDVWGAWTDQFETGRPGFAGGLQYEIPYRGTAAKAVVRQRQLEVRRLGELIREQIANIRAEVGIAVRDAAAKRDEYISRLRGLEIVASEVAYLQDRWETLGADPQLGRLQLEDLLSAYDRQLAEELSVVRALVEHNMAVIRVQYATGMLLDFAEE